MRLRLGTLALAAALRLAPASAAAPLSWAALEGRPAIERQTVAGFYLWREGDRVFVVGVGDTTRTRLYEGRLVVHGASVVDSQHLNGNRAGIVTTSPHEVAYSYSTRAPFEGLVFQLKRPDPGRLRNEWGSLDLSLHVDRNMAERVFIGPQAAETQQDPIVVTFGNNQPVSWDAFEGQPSIGGPRTGLFAWRDGDRIHVVSAERSGRTRSFKGRIIVCGGTIADARGERLDRGDSLRQALPSELDYAFDTNGDTDGLSFVLRRQPLLPTSHGQFHGRHEMPRGFLYICPNSERPEGSAVSYGRSARGSLGDPLIVEFEAARPLPWSAAEGRPLRLSPRPGYQVWHEGDKVFILTTRLGRERRRLAGQVVFSGGTLSQVLGLQMDGFNDRLTLTNPAQLDFAFDANDEVDGLGFTLDRRPSQTLFNGRRLPGGPGFLTLVLKVDGRPAENVSYGPQGVASDQDPLTFLMP